MDKKQTIKTLTIMGLFPKKTKTGKDYWLAKSTEKTEKGYKGYFIWEKEIADKVKELFNQAIRYILEDEDTDFPKIVNAEDKGAEKTPVHEFMHGPEGLLSAEPNAYFQAQKEKEISAMWGNSWNVASRLMAKVIPVVDEMTDEKAQEMTDSCLDLAKRIYEAIKNNKPKE